MRLYKNQSRKSNFTGSFCISQFQLRPPPPPGQCGAFVTLTCPHGRAFAATFSPGGRAFVNIGLLPPGICRSQRKDRDHKFPLTLFWHLHEKNENLPMPGGYPGGGGWSQLELTDAFMQEGLVNYCISSLRGREQY